MAEGITYWITGLSGSGKTTIGNRLYYELKRHKDNVVLLDGDILKSIFSPKGGYSVEQRRTRAYQYASLCKTLSDQGICVICCTIAMYEEVRQWNRENNKRYVEVFLDVSLDVLKQRDQKGLYTRTDGGDLVGVGIEADLPKHPDLVIINDGRYSIKECVDQILQLTVRSNSDYDRDTGYWNDYYTNGRAEEQPSRFALFAAEQMERKGSLLDLGCGNGRDSKFFQSIGMCVTGVDASDVVIEKLQKENEQEGNIFFICDDFVCSAAIYAGQYDHVYSRFSLHAITEKQEEELLKNIYKVLKDGGNLFIEARGIHDTIYGKGKQVGENAFVYNGHFRRFLVMEDLKRHLEETGFEVSYCEERTGFAPYMDDDPPIIRIIAGKPGLVI